MTKPKTIRTNLDVGLLEAAAYALPGDGKKWKRLCQDRRSLLIELALFGNLDGTSICPSANTLAKRFGWGRDKVFRRLSDLEDHLHFIITAGRQHERGTSMRRLNFDALNAKLAGSKSAKYTQQESGTRKPESDLNGSKRLEYTQQQSDIAHTKSLESKQQESDHVSDATTQSLPPNKPPQHTSSGVSGSGLFASKFIHHSRGGRIPSSNKEQIARLDRLALQVGPESFSQAVDTYLDECPASKLNDNTKYPMAEFVTNFESYVEIAKKRKADAAIALTKAERDAESERLATELAQRRHADELAEIERRRDQRNREVQQGEEELAALFGEDSKT